MIIAAGRRASFVLFVAFSALCVVSTVALAESRSCHWSIVALAATGLLGSGLMSLLACAGMVHSQTLVLLIRASDETMQDTMLELNRSRPTK